jgi:putative pyruvate formate lyase activating enzyme
MLEGYFSITEKRIPARHWISSRIPAGAESFQGLSDEDLWSLHAVAMSRFREVWGSGIEPPLKEEASLLDLKSALAHRSLLACRMCERRCGVNRAQGETGYCGVGDVSRVASNFIHFGEEPELVPSHTIFFAGCTFHCEYCQNWDIAMDARAGSAADPAFLASNLREGISQGARNANFVGGNPDPNLHTILDTIRLLGEDGKHHPMIWNSNMYTSREAMHLLEGVIDVYLADFRYGNDECARRYSDVDDYFRVVSRNFLIAHGQGDIMLRQLLLPGHVDCCTARIMAWVAENIPGIYFNLMFQYRPEYRAAIHPEIDRRLSAEEKREAIDIARRHGLLV